MSHAMNRRTTYPPARLPRKRPAVPVWAVIVAGVAVVMGAGVLAVAGVVALVSAGRPVTAPPPAPKLYSRAEFSDLVVGKTEAEVLKAVGKPHSTSGGTDDDPTWNYRAVTVDPVTGKTDMFTLVRFEDGIVVRVAY